jgi:hypothetical protein
MKIDYETLDQYLKSLGKSYSMLFTFKKGPIQQLKIHYAPHVDEVYYSYRNNEAINTEDYSGVDLTQVASVGFYSGLLISSFEENEYAELLDHIQQRKHFPVHNPDVLNRMSNKKVEVELSEQEGEEGEL